LIVGLLAGPTLASVPSATQCGVKDDGNNAECSMPCCAKLTDGARSCCAKPVADRLRAQPKGHCGSCPQGQCPCCDARPSLTVAVVLAGSPDAFPQPPAVRVYVAVERFDSRNDEPLLPPPIVCLSRRSLSSVACSVLCCALRIIKHRELGELPCHVLFKRRWPLRWCWSSWSPDCPW